MSVPKDCPKCGRFTKAAFGEDSWAHGPKYISGGGGRLTLGNVTEWLEYRCKDCGYTFFEPTKDAVVRSQEIPK